MSDRLAEIKERYVPGHPQADIYFSDADKDWLVAGVERLRTELADTWEAVSNAPYDYCTAHVADVVTRELERLREALEEIAEGKGRFSRDSLQHAENAIEDMKALARTALTEGKQ